MPLFQQSVLKKYLNDLDQPSLQKAWELFINLFHNSSKQENIRNAKEEQYQEGFLRELFVQVLDYTLNPEPNFNLTTEYKNEKDSKKADGAILKDGAVMGVIELKGTDTTDLAKIETQAFGYKNNQKGCSYVITSNFEKIRFYVNDAIDFEEFNLFLLTNDEFALLYLCLHKDNLLKDIPLKLKQASITEEETVTKKLYTDYSAFKKLLFKNITELNPQYDKLLLFQKTQKLLDRFLFILFAEDRLLLPPNSVREILKQWEQLKEMDAAVPLYDRFKLYFGYMNTGRTGKQHDIFAYNGGLFVADEVLDTIVINDDILYKSTFGLSNYNFETEVDVNILGHIFEHSLSEIEEVQSELEGKQIDKSKTRRKKDGVFYTPRYITKYIVENTVGTLCTQKKEELKMVDAEFTPEKRKANKKLLLAKLDEYRGWLLQLSICDPACGSGAFLNQALEFLITEHRYIDELRAKLFGDTLVLTDLENEILENNLYGVDINDEAVEIARLSLWLRTARKGRKLSSLNNNIKCGNSLIDDPAVAGDKAFNWQKEFPQIFGKYVEKTIVQEEEEAEDIQNPEQVYTPTETGTETESDTIYPREKITNQDLRVTNRDDNILNEPAPAFARKTKSRKGFDVVIGNPPYVPAEMINEIDKRYFENNYSSAVGRLNLYPLFYEKAIRIGHKYSKLGLITPYTILKNQYYSSCRKFILSNCHIDEIIDFKGVAVFADAAVDSIIMILSVEKEQNEKINIIDSIKDFSKGEYSQRAIQQKSFSEREDFSFEIAEQKLNIQKICSHCKTAADLIDFNQGVITGDNKAFLTTEPNNKTKKVITGSDFNRYALKWSGQFLIYDEKELHRPRKKEIFEVAEKIILRQTGSFPICSYDDSKYYSIDTVHNGLLKDSSFYIKYIMSLLNSKLLRYLYEQSINEQGKVFAQVKIIYINPLPIKITLKDKQIPFVNKADIMLSKNKELQRLKQNLLQLLQSKYESIKLSSKLSDWPTLSFADFLKELNKQKIKLSLAEQNEWMQYFEQEKIKANILQQIISQTDKEIDAMVYALYQLTEEEIKIVEGS